MDADLDSAPPGRALPDPMLLAASLRQPGPPGCAGLALAAAQLVSRHLRFDAADTRWPDRDRIVASPALAPLAASLGRLTGAAELIHVVAPAIGCGVGLALAERLLAGRFGRSLVDHRAWVLCDGMGLATGAAQEAAWLAGSWRLGRLTVLADGAPPGTAGLAGFAAAGWTVRHANAADPAGVSAALSAALRSVKPTLIACAGAWPEAAEDQPPDPAPWLAAGRRLAGIRRSWLKRLTRHAGRAEFDAALAGRLPPGWHTPLSDPGKLLPPGAATLAPADAIRAALPGLAASLGSLPLLPGAPDWPPPAGQADPPATRCAGRLALGIGAIQCGVALHGGTIALGVQPDTATDSLLPGLRAAAAAGIRLVLLLTEDAADPAATLQAVPDLAVFRPADASEALECVELAIRRTAGPSVVLLSAVPAPLLADRPARTHAARGFYLAAEPTGRRAATLLASGPQLHLALAARVILAAAGLDAAVASLPCPEIFARQSPAWQDHVLGQAPRFAIAPGAGWLGWLGPDGLVIGESSPQAVAERVLRHLRRAESVWTQSPRV